MEEQSEDIATLEWDLFSIDQATLFGLILAGNYLNHQSLLNESCKTTANLIKGKTPEEIHAAFNIEGDMAPEDEELMRRENEWI